MAAVAGDVTNLTNLDAVEVGYFGKSSTLDFVAHVQKILSESKPTDPVESSRQHATQFKRCLDFHTMAWSMLTVPRPSVIPTLCEEYIIPPRKESDTLMRIFWKKIHPLYPFLDRNQFECQYNDIWSSSPLGESPTSTVIGHDKVPSSRRFHFLLNTIFAIACSYDTSDLGLSQTRRGENYWQRSKALLEMDFDIFNRPNLHFVQGMLYASIYLQSSTELTGACWNIVGVSIRLAQGLGLHNRSSHSLSMSESLDGRPPAHSTLAPSCLRCRIWAGCVMMDRWEPPLAFIVTANYLQ